MNQPARRPTVPVIGDLKGAIALVTGAGGGIGRAIALALAREGATLCLAGRRPAPLEEVAMAVHSAAGEARSYAVELTSDRELLALADQVKREFARLDVLVHSAGVIAMGQVEQAPVSDLDMQYAVNVRAPYLLTQALLPLLKPRAGQIVFINSSAAQFPRSGVAQYAATKQAQRALADSLRQEVNGDGMRVTTVYVGRTATAMQSAVHRIEGTPYVPESLLQPEDVAAVVITALGLPRSAEVTEISIRPLRKQPA